ncbi:MAG: AAA family ATPase [Tepidibacter sp.]|jgi:DNA transposition AAA+ family ATPase|uniref:AAA family ATPase n=1 Tax=Tepidibacter sp. TaxID=2529387 RepID=UPI0025F3EB4F|nr:AAA family ATPase [Tepidibacter sp.]MCT4509913.1 AAA family ATPase [Tepidibacter sp.]
MNNYSKLDNQTKTPKFASTNAAEAIMLATRFAHANRDISLIYGEAGLGKSFSLNHYANTHDKVIYVEARECDRSTKGIAERILKSMGKSKTGTDRVLIDTIIETLKGSEKLLIVDEAQHLGLRAIENMRAINDEAKIGIVLCGNPTVYDRMHGKGQAHFAQLFSRLGIKRRISEPTRKDIEKIFTKFNLDNSCIDFLHAMSLSWGGLRNSIKIFKMAYDLSSASSETLSLAHFETAYQFKNGEE